MTLTCRLLLYSRYDSPNSLSLSLIVPADLSLHLPQVQFAVTLLLIGAYGFIKLSILYFYQRLFVAHRQSIFNRVLGIAKAIIIGWSVSFLFAFIFNCKGDIAANWGSRNDLIHHCPDRRGLENALYISEFLTNIMILVLPWATVRLHLLKASISPFGANSSRSGAYNSKPLAKLVSLVYCYWPSRELSRSSTAAVSDILRALAASIVRLIIVIQVDTKSSSKTFDLDRK